MGWTPEQREKIMAAKAAAKEARAEDEVINETKAYAEEQPIDAILSDEEKRELAKMAREKVKKELTKEQKDSFLAAEVKRLRLEAGIDKPTLGGNLDEMVNIMIDLRYEGSSHIQLNIPHGQCYFHGHAYTVPRHVANTLWEIMQRNSDHQLQVEGKSMIKERVRDLKLSPHGLTSGYAA